MTVPVPLSSDTAETKQGKKGPAGVGAIPGQAGRPSGGRSNRALGLVTPVAVLLTSGVSGQSRLGTPASAWSAPPRWTPAGTRA